MLDEYKEAIASWFKQLKQSEQYALLILVAMLIPYLCYVLLFKPLLVSNSNLLLANQRAAETFQQVRLLAAEYKQLTDTNQGVNTSINLPQLIDSSVLRYKLALKRMQPTANGEIQLRFEAINFNDFIAWLYELESQYAVVVKDLSVSPVADTGLVSSSLRLRKS